MTTENPPDFEAVLEWVTDAWCPACGSGRLEPASRVCVMAGILVGELIRRRQ